MDHLGDSNTFILLRHITGTPHGKGKMIIDSGREGEGRGERSGNEDLSRLGRANARGAGIVSRGGRLATRRGGLLD